MEYLKAKSAAKHILPRSSELESLILNTLSIIANVVGGTLGPGGHPVLIERGDPQLPPMVTKDGVTVFKAFGFENSLQHSIMEAARDAAIQTATAAGDGTTTATVIADALVRSTIAFCKETPRMSPHQVVQELHRAFKTLIEPEIRRLAVTANLSDDSRELLRNVAAISGNGDEELADAVMECYDICGDDGNVTIVETSGPHGYEVERVEGYPVAMGYEESCAKFYPAFITDAASQKVLLEKPMFVLYHGRVTDMQTLIPLLKKIGEGFEMNYIVPHNVVLVATGFSESVLGQLQYNFLAPHTINVFPLCIPQSPIPNGQRHFLEDLSAVTGAEILDPISKPLETSELEVIGNLYQEETENGLPGNWVPAGVRHFEAGRYRSTIVGFADEDEVLNRIDEVKRAAQHAESQFDGIVLRERAAKLSGGIAKLKVVGSSNGELKERRDRAEDAVCAVRGAIKDGCLPGGGWTLLRVSEVLRAGESAVVKRVLIPAIEEPVKKLFFNVGITDPEKILEQYQESVSKGETPGAEVYNTRTGEKVNAFSGGILDSAPAVLESIRNSLSIASLLGTLGGIIVFPRDHEFEQKEARDTRDFERAANWNPADERA